MARNLLLIKRYAELQLRRCWFLDPHSLELEMKTGLYGLVVAAVIGLGTAVSAHASVVTFDSYSPLNTLFSSTSDGGLDFAASSSGFAYVWDGNSPNSNGTPNLILGLGDSDTITITRSGGGVFDLNSIDFAISWFSTDASDTIFINGSPLVITSTLTTYGLNLVGVSSVTITGLSSDSGYWLADNIVYNAATSVPEPSSLALAALACAAMACRRRRMNRN